MTAARLVRGPHGRLARRRVWHIGSGKRLRQNRGCLDALHEQRGSQGARGALVLICAAAPILAQCTLSRADPLLPTAHLVGIHEVKRRYGVRSSSPTKTMTLVKGCLRLSVKQQVAARCCITYRRQSYSVDVIGQHVVFSTDDSRMQLSAARCRSRQTPRKGEWRNLWQARITDARNASRCR